MKESTETHRKTNAQMENKNQLISDIKEMLRSIEPLPSSKPCIYKVPHKLHKLNEEAYIPQVISIGPFHHGKERLKSMEKLKVKCLEDFRRRAKLNVEDLVNTIMKLEGSARHCYAEDIKFGRNDFVKIILVDASFIVEFLTQEGSTRLLDPWLETSIWQDLKLLENQLPFFVIEELYNLVRSSHGLNALSFTELACLWFVPTDNKKLSATPNLEIKHFIDLLRISLLPKSREENNDQDNNSSGGIPTPVLQIKLCINRIRTFLPLQERRSNEEAKHLQSGLQSHEVDESDDKAKKLPSVTQLCEAGVKFEVVAGKCLLDLDFVNGVLKIPCLRIEDSTASLFQNLVAFEQRHDPENLYLTNYIMLLDSLIDTTEDVDMLMRKGVLVHWLCDSKAVMAMVNNLSTNVLYSKVNDNYSHLYRDLNAFYRKRQHHWKAILMRDCGSTWRILSVAAVAILVVLILIQTVCSLILAMET